MRKTYIEEENDRLKKELSKAKKENKKLSQKLEQAKSQTAQLKKERLKKNAPNVQLTKEQEQLLSNLSKDMNIPNLLSD